MNAYALYSRAERLAREHDGSEGSYNAFMTAAITVDAAGVEAAKVDALLDMAIAAVQQVNREEDFLSKLERGGAKIFHHGAVFVRPDLSQAFADAGEDSKKFEPPVQEPRLREVVMALQDKGVFFDDIVVDTGRVHDGQMRKYPYAIITIPRLNAQIAVADQKDEALFVATPAIPFMNWALFEKKQAGAEGTPFENVKRIVHSGAWEKRMLDAVLGNDPSPGPKIHLDGYVKAQRKTQYPLTEEMVVAMARLTREHDPDKKWPANASGAINPEIVRQVTGDPHWQSENWMAVNSAGQQNCRGLTRSLRQTLDAHGCNYNLTEEMIVAMARLTRERDPDKKWPAQASGPISPEIVQQVTGDPHWQAETWMAVEMAGQKNCRGLMRSLRQTLDAHGCNYNLTEQMIVAMVRLTRERDPDKKWPGNASGAINPEIVRQVTGDPHWQTENWKAVDGSGRENNRGLTRSLSQTLDAHGCNYNLTEKIVVEMARLIRERDPKKKWPTLASGPIDPEIVRQVTGDPHWQAENWKAVDEASRRNCRGLTRSLSKILDAHCPERGKMVVEQNAPPPQLSV